ncbi:MAG: hypothetical protein GY847_15385 [Proteobacteria bacterium]|nr:hypothetical protein [Pseudomonadota bacterium]
MMNPLTPEDALECARQALREHVVLPIAKETPGQVVEVCIDEVQSVFCKRYQNGTDYTEAKVDVETKKESENDALKESAHLVLWLFGPERVPEPPQVYRLLSRNLVEKATAIIASEAPWPGKILSPGEFGEYTAEETAAALVRAGFTEIVQLMEGPFFRLWRARRAVGSAHIALIDAENYLDVGNWREAEKSLESVNEPLGSLEIVREYALLVAACHDLAGRTELCLDALSEALRLDPYCARAMCGLGRVAALKGDLGSAQDFFASALKLQPALVAALHGQAVISEAEGNLAKAFSSMIIASDLRPKDDDLMIETVRLGNAAGKVQQVSRFLEHRIGGRPMSPIAAEVFEGVQKKAPSRISISN